VKDRLPRGRTEARIDHAAMKLSNQLSVLRAVRDRGPITRIGVQRETGLSWGTVTTLVRDLVDRRLVVETGPVPTRAGRHPVEMDVNRRAWHAAGLRLGSGNVRAVVMDLKGGTASSVRLPVGARGSRRAILDRMFQCLDRALEEAGVAPRALSGIGVALPGAVDFQTGTGLYAPRHPQWKDVPVRDLLRSRYGAPCFVDHDNNCSVMGERCFGQARGVDDFLCVVLGKGVSVGIMIGGRIHRGVDSMAGELGHVVIDPEGPRCACGRRGCLEALASGDALAEAGRKIARRKRPARLLEAAGGDPGRVTAFTLNEAAAAGDPDARRLFSDMGRILGRGLGTLVNLFNPDRVILCGQLSRAHAWFLPAALQAMEDCAWSYSRREILVSDLEDSATAGAAGTVINEAFSTGLLLAKSRARQRPAARVGSP
jgi:N-acetylglucosamine repressor